MKNNSITIAALALALLPMRTEAQQDGQVPNEPAPSTQTTSSEPAWTFSWVNIYDSSASSGENVAGAQFCPDGNIVTLGLFGCDATSADIFVNGESTLDANGQAVVGRLGIGAGVISNLLVQKLDATTGAPVWTLYTNDGDVLSVGNIAVDEQGNIFFTMEPRVVAATEIDSDGNVLLASIVDGIGVKTAIKTAAPKGEFASLRFQKGVIVKLSKDGGYLSHALLDIDNDYKYAGKTVSQGTFPNGLTTADDGSLFVCGAMAAPFNVLDSQGQKTRMGQEEDSAIAERLPYILKFDNDLHLVKTFCAKGAAGANGQFNNIVFQGGRLYVDGDVRVINGGEDKFSIGNEEFAPAVGTSWLFGCLDAELNVQYLRHFDAKTTAVALMHNGLQIFDEKVYLSGHVKGEFDYGSSLAAAAPSYNTAATLVLNIADGEPQGLMFSPFAKSVSGCAGIVMQKGAAYAIGYDTKATFVAEKFDAKTYEHLGTTTLFSYMTTMVGKVTPIVSGNRLVIASRCGKSKAAGTSSSIGLYADKGNRPDFSINGWATFFASWVFDNEESSAITDVFNDNDRDDFDVYTLGGVLMRKANSAAEAVAGLKAGLYVVGGKLTIVR